VPRDDRRRLSPAGAGVPGSLSQSAGNHHTNISQTALRNQRNPFRESRDHLGLPAQMGFSDGPTRAGGWVSACCPKVAGPVTPFLRSKSSAVAPPRRIGMTAYQARSPSVLSKGTRCALMSARAVLRPPLDSGFAPGLRLPSIQQGEEDQQ
jgi:hypothetical protein